MKKFIPRGETAHAETAPPAQPPQAVPAWKPRPGGGHPTLFGHRLPMEGADGPIPGDLWWCEGRQTPRGGPIQPRAVALLLWAADPALVALVAAVLGTPEQRHAYATGRRLAKLRAQAMARQAADRREIRLAGRWGSGRAQSVDGVALPPVALTAADHDRIAEAVAAMALAADAIHARPGDTVEQVARRPGTWFVLARFGLLDVAQRRTLDDLVPEQRGEHGQTRARLDRGGATVEDRERTGAAAFGVDPWDEVGAA